MKEKVLEALSNMGFQVEEREDGNVYLFTYEGANFLYLHSDDDEDFLNICLPGIEEIGDNINRALALMDLINSRLKFLKAYRMGDSIWLFYERELLGEDDLQSIIERMIIRLETGLGQARLIAAEIDKNFSETYDA